jgi:hypothetical protein
MEDLAGARKRQVRYRLGRNLHFGNSLPVERLLHHRTGNSAILFDNIEGADGVWSMTDVSQECLENDVPAGDLKNPMGIFNAALANGQTTNFNFIIPNGCEDGEANCDPVHNRYTQFDDFLGREVPPCSVRNPERPRSARRFYWSLLPLQPAANPGGRVWTPRLRWLRERRDTDQRDLALRIGGRAASPLETFPPTAHLIFSHQTRYNQSIKKEGNTCHD